MKVLAKKYCEKYHKGQFRRSGEPYSAHPIGVAKILEKYGYSDDITQSMAYMHDLVEDTSLKTKELQKVFGYEVSNGIHILSKNTLSYSDKLISNFDETDLYKLRILMARSSIQRVKIADLIHNTLDPSGLLSRNLEKKIKNIKEFYIPLGRKIAPEMVKELEKNVESYRF